MSMKSDRTRETSAADDFLLESGVRGLQKPTTKQALGVGPQNLSQEAIVEIVVREVMRLTTEAVPLERSASLQNTSEPEVSMPGNLWALHMMAFLNFPRLWPF